MVGVTSGPDEDRNGQTSGDCQSFDAQNKMMERRRRPKAHKLADPVVIVEVQTLLDAQWSPDPVHDGRSSRRGSHRRTGEGGDHRSVQRIACALTIVVDVGSGNRAGSSTLVTEVAGRCPQDFEERFGLPTAHRENDKRT